MVGFQYPEIQQPDSTTSNKYAVAIIALAVRLVNDHLTYTKEQHLKNSLIGAG